MDLQLKIGLIMIGILFIQCVAGGTWYSLIKNEEERRYWDRGLEIMLRIVFLVFFLTQAWWSLFRIWNC